MGSIEGGNLGQPNPIQRLFGSKSAGSIRETLSDTSGGESAEVRSDSVQLNLEKNRPADPAKAAFFEFNLRATRAILERSTGKADSSRQFNVQSIEVYGRVSVGNASQAGDAESTTEGTLNPLASLQEYFSPENTSNRIFEFALTRYGYGRFAGTDGSENRAAYRDFIFPAIEKGFHEALDAFGTSLSEDVLGQLRSTLDKIKVSFENFVAGAPDAGSGELPDLAVAGAPQGAE